MTTLVDEVSGVNELRASDRCARCEAQAYVRVSIAGTTLDWCGHHYREHEPALTAQGAKVITDQRKLLEQQPGASV